VIPWLGAGISLAVLLAGAGIYSTSGHPGGLFIGGLGALGTVALAGIALGSRRFDFDRVRGELRVRRFGMTRTYPLDRIRAVQLIPGGWHAGASQRPGFYSYQMNLVLADPPRPRLNVTDTANRDKTRETGSTLAGFLKVPLLHDGEPE
jgi:hypothetical protein